MSFEATIADAAISTSVTLLLEKVADTIRNYSKRKKRKLRKALTGSTRIHTPIGITTAMFERNQISLGESQRAMPESEADAVMWIFPALTNIGLVPLRQTNNTIFDTVFHIGGPIYNRRLRYLLKSNFPDLKILLHPGRISKSQKDSLFRQETTSEGLQIGEAKIMFDGEYFVFGHVVRNGKRHYFVFGNTHFGSQAGVLSFLQDSTLQKYVINNASNTYLLAVPVQLIDDGYLVEMEKMKVLYHFT